MTGNKIYGAKNNGIDVQKSQDVDVIKNEVKNSGNNGIMATSALRVHIDYNEVTSSNNNGIFVDDSRNARVRDNNVFKANMNGILVTNSNRARVNDNTVNGTAIGNGSNLTIVPMDALTVTQFTTQRLMASKPTTLVISALGITGSVRMAAPIT